MFAVISLTLMGLMLGALLGIAARYFAVEGNPLQAEILEILPGSQCGQCGFAGCNPAAEALANGKAPVTLCPPGGKAVVEKLAAKLGVTIDLASVADNKPKFAFINEALCIGCQRCFKRCPTDAIMGGPKQLHTVISDACTGCGKCVDTCPTECIRLREIKPTLQTWHWHKPDMAIAERISL